MILLCSLDELDVAPTHGSNVKQEKKETDVALVTAIDKAAADVRAA